MTLSYEETIGDKHIFKAEEYPNNPTFGNAYMLSHYPCSDSIEFSSMNNSSGMGYKAFGKKVNGVDCPNEPTPTFEPVSCANGPNNEHCYSSVNIKFNMDFGNINEIKYISIDSVNQTVQIGEENFWHITVPTDTSFKLLEGNYQINESSQSDLSILDVYIIRPFEFGPFVFDDFIEGSMNVQKNDDIYTLSFVFTCYEPANWTGYYQGLIN